MRVGGQTAYLCLYNYANFTRIVTVHSPWLNLVPLLGILAALQERYRTGRGQVIDVGLYACMVGLLRYLAQLYLLAGRTPSRLGRHWDY